MLRQARDLTLTDHTSGLVRKRRVQRQDVGLLEQAFQRCYFLNAQCFEPRLRNVRIIGDHVHPECTSTRSDLASNPAQPNDTECSTFQLGAKQRLAIPPAVMHRTVATWHVTQK